MGIDDTVRKYLKKDEHIVLAVLGCYAGIFGLYKINKMLTKKPVPAALEPVAPVVSTGGSGANQWGFEFPTLETFDAWSANAENWKKWEAFMDGPVDKWMEGKVA
mmetsp:Transcript_27516/g.45832  ORF Transcript_27516/g.45832 Transcript_27516/m.45832 type:complete len:105 (+) Transcript_27516:55-369(+)